jgi:exonuclease III
VRIISWNVQRRVGDGLRRQVEALEARRPDLVALQEVTTTSGPLLREAMQQAGWAHVELSLDRVPAARRDHRRSRSGVLLASRWPLRPLPPPHIRVPWPERVLSALVDSPWGTFELHTAYIPNAATGPAIGHPWLKVETFEGLCARLGRRARRPRILCGDFNAPLSEQEDGRVVPFGKRGRAAAAELGVFVDLARFDLADVFRAVRGYAEREFSWYGQLNGYRLDHLFASRALGAYACEYRHELRTGRLSDHAAIEADFAPRSNGSTA